MPIGRVNQNFTEEPAAVSPYFKTIIENKVARVALTCFETIVHWFLTTFFCFYPAYSRFYEQQKIIELNGGEVTRSEASRSGSQSSEDEPPRPRETLRTISSSNSEGHQSSPSSNDRSNYIAPRVEPKQAPGRTMELTREPTSPFEPLPLAPPKQQSPTTLQQIEAQISMATSIIEEVQRLSALEQENQALTEPLLGPEPSPVDKSVTIVDAKDSGLEHDEVWKKIKAIADKELQNEGTFSNPLDYVKKDYFNGLPIDPSLSSPETILLARAGQEVAGFIITAKTTEEPEDRFLPYFAPSGMGLVAYLAVDSKMKRSGIGTKLMLAAMAKTKALGKRYLKLQYITKGSGLNESRLNAKRKFFASFLTRFGIPTQDEGCERLGDRLRAELHYDLKVVDFTQIIPGLIQNPPLEEEEPGSPKIGEQALPALSPVDLGPPSQADERQELRSQSLEQLVKYFYFEEDTSNPVYQEVISEKLPDASTWMIMELLETVVLHPWTSCDPGVGTVDLLNQLLQTELSKRLNGYNPLNGEADTMKAAQIMLNEKLVLDLQQMQPTMNMWHAIPYKFQPYSFRSAALLKAIYEEDKNDLGKLMDTIEEITNVDKQGVLKRTNLVPVLETAPVEEMKKRVAKLNHGRDPYDDTNPKASLEVLLHLRWERNW